MTSTVITGASGFIGKALTRKLLEADVEVWAIVTEYDKLKDLYSERLHVVECDFSNYNRLAEKLPNHVDWFVHTAWTNFYGRKSRDVIVQSKNILASTIAMEQAVQIGASRFLFVGSSYQYRMEPVMISEHEVFIRNNIYGIAKEATSRMLRARALECGIKFNTALFTNVFGVGDRSNRSTNTMLRQLLQGESLKLISGEHQHDWTYIDDAVEGLLAVLEHGMDGVEYYIGSRKPKTFREIIVEVRDTIAPRAELEFGAYEDKAYIDYSLMDLNALYRDTGCECKSDFRESIRKTAEWLQQEDELVSKNKTKMGISSNPGGGTVIILLSLSLFCDYRMRK